MENNSAGNTVSRHRAASGKLPFLMFCDKEILYHGFLCFASIMVTVTQATVLNFFIIAFFRGYYHQVSLIRKFDEFLTFIFDLLMRSWQSVKNSSNWNIHWIHEDYCKQSQFKTLLTSINCRSPLISYFWEIYSLSALSPSHLSPLTATSTLEEN